MASWFKRLNSAKKSMIRRALVVLVAYELVFSATFYWVIQGHLSGSSLLWVALLPTLTMVAFIFVVGRYLKDETDEFHRSWWCDAYCGGRPR